MASLANAIQTIAQSNQNERTIIVGMVLAAPVAFGDQILVVTDYAPLSPIGPMDFGASQGSTLPAAGDACVVVYDDDHKPYCVWFDGTYSSGQFQPQTAPPAPAAGFVVYVDIVDDKLKAKAATGTITVLAIP